MTAWKENGYKMKAENGTIMVLDRGVWYEFVRWDSDDNGAVVAVVKLDFT